MSGPGNSPDRPFQSTLELLEEDCPLTTGRHAFFAEISDHGAGRYNHYANELYFSTSDGTNPNENGRRYRLVEQPPRPRILTLGTCHVGNLFYAAAVAGRVETVIHDDLSYNPDDTAQLIERRLGLRRTPDYLRAFTARGGREPEPGWLRDADGLVLEISSRSLVRCDGQSLLPTSLWSEICVPLIAEAPELESAATSWYRVGLMRHEEDVRIETAEALLCHLRASCGEDDPKVRVVRDTRSRLMTDAEIADGMARVLALIDRPAVLLLHVWQYMPDGRPFRWPRGMHEVLLRIAGDLGLPVVDPAEAVEARGAETSLTENLMYYRPAVLADLYDAVLARLADQGMTARGAGE